MSEKQAGASLEELSIRVGSVFTPGSPVNEKDLFAGRLEQFDRVLDAATERGFHAVIYGERGVGKTSLANIITNTLRRGERWIIPRVNCDAADDFSSLWRKALQDLAIARARNPIGFGPGDAVEYQRILDTLPDVIRPDDVRRTLEELAEGIILVMIFDEFDRVTDEIATVAMADTIKSLSDFAVPATIILIGVADSVDDLVSGHQSIERALIQIQMPRMSKSEIQQIITNGLARLDMKISDLALAEIVSLSQGLPYITHLLALHSTKSALADGSQKIEFSHVENGIQKSLDKMQQSVIRAYYDATNSSQPGNIYKPVLLACALAESDELGYFTASGVRMPLRVITGRDYDIPNFAQHLKNFSDEDRGGIITRVGERRIRYRFTSPLLRPYIIMKSVSDNLITRRQLQKITQSKTLNE